LINIYFIVVYLVAILTTIVFCNPQQAMGQKELQSSISNASTISGFLTYENTFQGIKMQYPSNWTMSVSDLRSYTDVVAFYSPLQNLSDAFPARLVLSVSKYSQNISLDEHTNLTVGALNQSEDLILNESNPFTLAKNPAHQIIFSAISPSAPFNFNVMQVSTTIGDKLYTLSYEAVAPKFSKNLPIIQQMLQSLEIE
jgi:hypothetical protein